MLGILTKKYMLKQTVLKIKQHIKKRNFNKVNKGYILNIKVQF
jgi:hypothetical protein